MRITEPKAIDSGRYSCKVTTESGVCITSTNLKILKDRQGPAEGRTPSLILAKPEDVTATTDAAVSFAVQVAGDDVDVKWFVCGREVTRSDRGVLVSELRP